MKVYACPEEISLPEIDYDNFNMEKRREGEAKFYLDLTIYLETHGYRGKHTGKQIHFPIADGHATYVVADSGRSMVLFHSPLGDAWHAHPILLRGLRKSDVVDMVNRENRIAKLFSHRT